VAAGGSLLTYARVTSQAGDDVTDHVTPERSDHATENTRWSITAVNLRNYRPMNWSWPIKLFLRRNYMY